MESILPEERKQEIIKALSDRNAIGPCPRCENKAFTLLDGYFSQSLQSNPTGMVLGGPTVPSIVMACNRCGFLSHHALGALGLLPEKESKDG